MKINLEKKRRGFTLIELSMAMGLGMTVAALVLAMVNQQLAFLKIFSAQNFITEEAPIVNTYVSKLVGKSDRFTLHDNVSDAQFGFNGRASASPVLAMYFRQPDDTVRKSVLAFEDRGEGLALYYYVQIPGGTWSYPEWTVTRKAQDVAFTVEAGILRMTLTGPNGERLIYSGTMQQ